MSHAIKPPLCGKKGGGHKNVRVSKSLRCVSQRKLARKQNPGISMRKLALWPRKWCVSAGVSNSLRPCEMKDLFSTAQMELFFPSYLSTTFTRWSTPTLCGKPAIAWWTSTAWVWVSQLALPSWWAQASLFESFSKLDQKLKPKFYKHNKSIVKS